MSDWIRWVGQLGRREDLINQRFVLTGIGGCGKKVLLRQLLSGEKIEFLDEEEASALAKLSPMRLVQTLVGGGYRGMADIQRVPQLTEYLKESGSVPEAWGMTVSADINFPASIRRVRLRPLTEGEILGSAPRLIERLLTGDLPERLDSESECSLRTILDKAVLGGFPVLLRLNFRQRSRGYRLWIDSLLRQNLPALGTYRQLSLMERMLNYCACHSSEANNIFRMAEDLGKTRVVTKKYFEAVKQLFAVDELPAWSESRSDWVERSPKLMFCDSGYVSRQANVRRENLELLLGNSKRQSVVEQIVKTWIYQQLAPLTDIFRDWHLYHYRSYKGQAVDFLLERDDGVVIGFNVRLKETVSADDLNDLRWFQRRYGKTRRIVTVLLYAGGRVYRYGDDEYALPMSFLWL